MPYGDTNQRTHVARWKLKVENVTFGVDKQNPAKVEDLRHSTGMASVKQNILLLHLLQLHFK